MTIQQNSPGSRSSNKGVSILFTALIWCAFGIVLGFTASSFVTALLSALVFAVGNMLIFLDPNQGSSLIRWHPLLTLWAACAGLLIAFLIFDENPTSASVFALSSLLLSRAYFFPKDSRKSRKARDIGV